MTAIFPDAYYVTSVTQLTDTSETTCYTCPTDKHAYVLEIWSCDVDGTANTLTIKATINSTQYALAIQRTTAKNSDYSRLTFSPLVLDAGDTIECTAGSATVDVFVNAAEIATSVG